MPASRNGTDAFDRIHHFETISGAFWKPDVHHLHRMNPLAPRESPVRTRSATVELRALAFA
jgi:hypothetical protein